MALLAEGHSNAEIGAALYIGVETVKTHVRQVFAKLAVRNRVEGRELRQPLRRVQPAHGVTLGPSLTLAPQGPSPRSPIRGVSPSGGHGATPSRRPPVASDPWSTRRWNPTGPSPSRRPARPSGSPSWPGLAPFEQSPPRAALVVAPHPDDETYAVGGTLAMWAQAGTELTIVAVTDGEGSHPGRPGLAAERRAEQSLALRALGVRTEPIRLGLPDTKVDEHQAHLVSCLADQAERLDTGARDQPAVIVAPWDRDAHCDHDVAGRVASLVARKLGAPFLAYPAWAWQWATPGDFAGLDLRRHRLTADARSRKATAEAAFTSQTTSLDGAAPVLSDQFRERFRRADEVMIVVDRA